jgi:hypothetical protein
MYVARSAAGTAAIPVGARFVEPGEEPEDGDEPEGDGPPAVGAGDGVDEAGARRA